LVCQGFFARFYKNFTIVRMNAMTITALGTDGYGAFGYVYLGAEEFVDTESTVIYAIERIYPDLADIVAPYPDVTYYINWCFIIKAGRIDNNPNRFKGPYLKYNLGIVDFSFNGLGTQTCYWNFISQRFPTMSAWSVNGREGYPSFYEPPAYIDNASLETMGGEQNFGLPLNYATEFALQIDAATQADIQGVIYYQAIGNDTRGTRSYGLI